MKFIKMPKLTTAQIDFIKANYTLLTDNQIAEQLEVKYHQVRWTRRQLKLTKTIEMTKSMEFKSHQFKIGHLPKNALKEGTITIRKDKRGIGYKYIKEKGVNPMRMLHVIVWEKQNGKVPKNHIVIFKDGDTMNCEIENLACITKAENLVRNRKGYLEKVQIIRQDPELYELHLATRKLNILIKEKSKK